MGPERYDIVGDLHGCVAALRRLCDQLGYDSAFHHPEGRTLVFVGDIVTKGPDSVGALRLAVRLLLSGRAWSVLGNRDDDLRRAIEEPDAALAPSVARTLAEIGAQPDGETLRASAVALFRATPLVLTLDGGRLVVAHAGIEERMLGRQLDEAACHFVLHGDEIGTAPDGSTVRRDWAAEYCGSAFVVYGHTPQPSPLVRRNSANIDTGAYRGNALTALRWPEGNTVSERA